MKKIFLSVFLLAIFLFACTKQEDTVPPFPDSPGGQATVEAAGLEIVTAGPYNPNQEITIKLTKTDGVYAVYRKIFYKPSVCPATGECWRELTATVQNGFAGQTATYTALTPTVTTVQGKVNIPADAVGVVKFGVATYKLVNGAWSTDMTVYLKQITVQGSDLCPTVGVHRCNGDIRQKCGTNKLWENLATCELGCKSATTNGVVSTWCKECSPVGEKACQGNKVITCNANFKNVTATDCLTKPCVESATGPVCGVCVNGAKKCKSDAVLQTCTNGAWVESTCPFVCSSNACVNAPTG